MREKLHERPPYQYFVGLEGAPRRPNETVILRFRHLLEKHQLTPEVLFLINSGLTQQGLLLTTGMVVEATIIAAQNSTKNNCGARDPKVHQTNKSNQWRFGFKAHIGANAESGLVASVIGTAANVNVNDSAQVAALLHGEGSVAFANPGYPGTDKRPEAKPGVTREASGKPGQIIDKIEHLKASVRAKV